MKTLLVVFSTLLLAAGSAQAGTSTMEILKRRHPIGVGILLGAPSGVTAQFYQSGNRSIQVGAALGYFGYFMTHGDYLFHLPNAFQGNPEFSPYFGPGVFAMNSYYLGAPHAFSVGVRATAGAQWIPKQYPFSVFLEVGPGVGILPATTALLFAGLGARYFF